MANQIYRNAANAVANGLLSWTADTFACALLDLAIYTPDLNDQFVSDIPAGGIVAQSPNLVGKIIVDGYLRATDVTFSSVSGPPVAAMAVFKNTGVPATSELFLINDTVSVNPNGLDVDITWDNSTGVAEIAMPGSLPTQKLSYFRGVEAWFTGELDWIADTFELVLVDTTLYAVDPVHETIAEIPPGARIATAEFTNKSVLNGRMCADPVEFVNLSGRTVGAVVGMHNSGVDATSWLHYYSGTQIDGIPFQPSGNTLRVQFAAGCPMSIP